MPIVRMNGVAPGNIVAPGRGAKAYFYAKREGASLRIFTDRIAPPQPW